MKFIQYSGWALKGGSWSTSKLQLCTGPNYCLASTTLSKLWSSEVENVPVSHRGILGAKKWGGPNFIHPHPPTPENTLPGVGGA